VYLVAAYVLMLLILQVFSSILVFFVFVFYRLAYVIKALHELCLWF